MGEPLNRPANRPSRHARHDRALLKWRGAPGGRSGRSVAHSPNHASCDPARCIVALQRRVLRLQELYDESSMRFALERSTAGNPRGRILPQLLVLSLLDVHAALIGEDESQFLNRAHAAKWAARIIRERYVDLAPPMRLAQLDFFDREDAEDVAGSDARE